MYTEYVTREELGQNPSADDLLTRFPQWQDRLRRLLDVHSGFVGATPPPIQVDTLHLNGLKDVTRVIDSPPEQIGAYVIEDILGRGGMGVVYRARHVTLKRRVALKRLLVGEWASDEEGKRFRTEAEAISRLDHVNIVRLFEFGEHVGQPYLILELIEGGSLAELLTRGPLPISYCVELIESLAHALQHAHDRAILHRDLKPGNIMLQTPDGDWPLDKDDPLPKTMIAKITDFGLAKRLNATHALSESDRLVGTPAYMPPERLDGKNDDPASDIYSLGVVMYECLTGRPPFFADSPLTTLAMVRDRDPLSPTEIRPDCPRDLAVICLQCLQKDPRRRYVSAQALADDLHRFKQGVPIHARATGTLERLVKWGKRRPAVASLLALVISLTLFSGALITFLWLTTAQALTETENARQKTATALKEVEKQSLELQDALAAKNLALAHYQYGETKLDAARASLLSVPEKHRDDSWKRLHRQLFAQRAVLRVDSAVHLLQFNRDGRYLAMYTREPKDNIWVWDIHAGKALFTHTSSTVIGFFFAADNKRLGVVTLSEMANAKQKLAVEFLTLDGRIDGTLTLKIPAGQYPYVHPDSRMLTCVQLSKKDGGAELLLWDLDTGATRKLACKKRPSFAVIAEDRSRIGLFLPTPPSFQDWEFEILDGQTFEKQKEHSHKIVPVTHISRDFKYCESLVSFASKDIGMFSRHDLQTGKLAFSYSHPGQVNAHAVSRDNDFLALAGRDRIVYLVNVKNSKDVLALRGHENHINQVQFTPSGEWLASVDMNGVVRIWSLRP